MLPTFVFLEVLLTGYDPVSFVFLSLFCIQGGFLGLINYLSHYFYYCIYIIMIDLILLTSLFQWGFQTHRKQKLVLRISNFLGFLLFCRILG
jgi:hypothetical protein